MLGIIIDIYIPCFSMNGKDDKKFLLLALSVFLSKLSSLVNPSCWIYWKIWCWGCLNSSKQRNLGGIFGLRIDLLKYALTLVIVGKFECLSIKHETIDDWFLQSTFEFPFQFGSQSLFGLRQLSFFKWKPPSLNELANHAEGFEIVNRLSQTLDHPCKNLQPKLLRQSEIIFCVYWR